MYKTKELDAKVVSKLITGIANRARKLDIDIHQAAIQSMIHAEKYDNFDMGAKLVKALGRGHRTKALILWFTTFGPFKTVLKGKARTFDNFKKDTLKSAQPFDILAAEDMPFWNLIPEVVPQAVTFETITKMIDAAVKKAEKLDIPDQHRVNEYIVAKKVA